MAKEVRLTKKNPSSKFGAFNGVFIPTFLSIIGVILFLRLGFIVGSAGILPTIGIILLAVSVTFATGLSLSSITTNIRIGQGGAYSIISKTLGLEIGGSVGIPMYLAQVFSITLYMFGFLEVWNLLFPTHPRMLVLGTVFTILFLLTFISTKIALRAQFIVFLTTIATLITILCSGDWLHHAISTPLIGTFPEFSFWSLFALFFPAVTGIMSGVGLSGELQDPKKQIPRGLLWGIGITTLIYIIVAIWLAFSASATQLVENNLIMVELASIPLIVIIGLLASTLSSALAMFVAAPRVLQAMANKSLFPGSRFLSNADESSLHRVILVTSIPVLIALAIADLNAVAPVITMFFLIAYAIINIVVFIEQSIGLVSFRPTLSIPRIVPLYGAITSLVFMFMINILAGFIALVFVVGSYIYLVKRKIKSTEGDIRSGLFIAFSEWAARKVETLPESSRHTWKPNILLPVLDTGTLLGNFPLIKSITYPNGNMTVLGLDIQKATTSPHDSSSSREQRASQLKELSALVKKFGKEGIFTSSSTVSAKDYLNAVSISLEAMESQTFSPNVLFLPFKPKRLSQRSLETIFATAKKHGCGVILSDRDEEVGLGSQEDIHVWVDPSVLGNDLFDDKPFDLSLLVAYRLHRNWAGKITLWMCVPKTRKEEAQRFMKKLVYEARFPGSTQIILSTQSFSRTLRQAPKGDIHIVPISSSKQVAHIRAISEKENKSFFFIADSGKEDVLA